MKNTTAILPISQTDGYESDEWYTPSDLIEVVHNFYGIGGIDLDPCSSEAAQKVVKALDYFDKNTNCLDMEWEGNVWLNPPYSGQNVRLITAYAIAQYEAKKTEGMEILILVNNCTDTAWFQALCAYPVVFTSSRLKFWRQDGEYKSPRQGQALFYLGKRKTAFFATFSDFGYAPNVAIYNYYPF